jgi:hypothetical protein
MVRWSLGKKRSIPFSFVVWQCVRNTSQGEENGMQLKTILNRIERHPRFV